MEKGRGEGADDACGRESGGDEYAFGLPAVPGPGRHSAGAAAAHPAGDCGTDGRYFVAGRGVRTVPGVCAEPSPRVRIVFPEGIRTVPFGAIDSGRGEAGGAAGAGHHETKGSGKTGRIARRARGPGDGSADGDAWGGDAAD